MHALEGSLLTFEKQARCSSRPSAVIAVSARCPGKHFATAELPPLYDTLAKTFQGFLNLDVLQGPLVNPNSA